MHCLTEQKNRYGYCTSVVKGLLVVFQRCKGTRSGTVQINLSEALVACFDRHTVYSK